MTREELALETEHLDLLEANAAAKDAYRADPTPKTKAAKEAASEALREFRLLWRGIRDYIGAPVNPDDGVARPKAVNMSLKSGKV